MKQTTFIFLAIIIATAGFTQVKDFDSSVLTEAWQADGFSVPESVLYDELRDVIFVSNINGKPTDKDMNGFISKLEPGGDIIDRKWVEGNLSAPKGMGIHDGKLYVTDIDAVVKIDIEEAKIIKRYPVDGAKFMNDIAIDEDGIVYATDMTTNKIHKLENDHIEPWLENEQLDSPNGLLMHQGRLLVGCKEILAIDTKTKDIQVIIGNLTNGVDGMVMDKYDNLFFSYWKGNVFKYDMGGHVTEVISTANREIQSADIGINKNENILYVPTFFDNRVVAYHIHIPEE